MASRADDNAVNAPRATTIAKYIARFRQERPRARAERGDVRREDFWWTTASQERQDTASRRGATPDKAYERGNEASHVREWEADLLSAYSDSQVVGASMESSMSLWSMPSLMDSEPTTTPPSKRHSPPPVPEEIIMEAFPSLATSIEDDSVLLSEFDLRPDHELDAVEDAELVIQRVRRRLGLQARSFAPLSAMDVRVDEPKHSFDYPIEPFARSLEPVAFEPLSMEHLMVSSVDLGPVERSNEADGQLVGSLEMTQDVNFLGDDLPEEEDVASPLGSTDAPSGFDEESKGESSPHGSVEVDIVEQSNVSEEQASIEPAQLTAGSVHCIETDAVETKDEAPQILEESVYHIEEEELAKEELGASLPPSCDSSITSFEPTQSPLKPVTVEEGADDIPVETAKTLDSLVSLVVHCWGEESDDDEPPTVEVNQDNGAIDHPGEEKEEEEEKEEQAEEDEDISLSGELPSPMLDECDSQVDKLSTCTEPEDDSWLELANDDAIVRMLRDRIALYEEALHQMELMDASDR
ncbi:hypothetical protein Poli38472_013302 [Pythium oligandrum]|uniref:Uncharacterized protein n=1 Tax=Pythium oligandrum TaxID=41045 RepID=A0A8K1FAU0_PYTOL|nr:hypothetical protein Poli38472_013302 [Pythium oligandrum]|eukprot:TMW55411.1 hypothetical protein Poli38472_013302 [Pythium oligandrum]